ncbi:hypothetical protein Tco_1077390 [Tanacetum coccineum]
MPLLCSYKKLGHHQEGLLEQQDLSLFRETQLEVVVELSKVDMHFEEQKVECGLAIVDTKERCIENDSC